MSVFPTRGLKPFYDELKTWLFTSHNADGTLRDDVLADMPISTATGLALADKADQVDLDTTNTTVATKANQSDMVAAQSTIATHDTYHTLARAQRYDPADAAYGAVRGSGVSGAVRTANTAAINAAAAAALAAGGVLVIKGSYEIDPGVVIRCNVDALDATLTVPTAFTGVAALVGSRTVGDYTQQRIFNLPRLQGTFRALGTAWSGNDIGYELANLNACTLTLPDTYNFTTNIWITAYGATGWQHNQTRVLRSHAGRILMLLETQSAGAWINENLFIGGQFNSYGADTALTTGRRHIALRGMATAGLNSNIFLKPSIEGGSGLQYMVELGTNTAFNRFISARWEGAGVPKLLLGQDARGNVVDFGYDAESMGSTLIGTSGTGQTRNTILSTQLSKVQQYQFHNLSGSGHTTPAITVIPAGSELTDPATPTVRIGASTSGYRAAADTENRIELNHTSGILSFGVGGSTAPSAALSCGGTDVLKLGAGDTLYIDSGAFGSGKLRIGSTFIYLDANGLPRFKVGAGPFAALDGVEFGQPTIATSQTASFTAAGARTFYPCDATAGTITVTLPTAVDAVSSVLVKGREYIIKKTDASANTVIVDANGSQTLDGALTKTLGSQYAFIRIVSDGANWHLIGQNGTIT